MVSTGSFDPTQLRSGLLLHRLLLQSERQMPCQQMRAKYMKEVRAQQRADERAVAADRAAAAETAAESSMEQSTEQAPTVNIPQPALTTPPDFTLFNEWLRHEEKPVRAHLGFTHAT